MDSNHQVARHLAFNKLIKSKYPNLGVGKRFMDNGAPYWIWYSRDTKLVAYIESNSHIIDPNDIFTRTGDEWIEAADEFMADFKG